jgi:TonB family protein
MGGKAMKNIITISSILLLIITWACTHNLEKTDEDYTAPSIKSQSRLIYPKAAQENGYEGNTRVVVTITDKGEVQKANVVKTSGHKVLDDAAIDFCRKLTFNPALRADTPVYSKMEWDVKFHFKNRKWNGELYVQNILSLYGYIEIADDDAKNDLQKKLLKAHDKFVFNMKDGINFNYYIGQVISEELLILWEDDWDSYPLTFLLYHDFIQRYQNYEELDSVRSQLESSLLSDIYFINNTPEIDYKEKEVKDNLIRKVKAFITQYYPEINIENIEIKAQKFNELMSSHN